MKQVIWLPAKGSVETWKTDLAFLCVFAQHLTVLILENWFDFKDIRCVDAKTLLVWISARKGLQRRIYSDHVAKSKIHFLSAVRWTLPDVQQEVGVYSLEVEAENMHTKSTKSEQYFRAFRVQKFFVECDQWMWPASCDFCILSEIVESLPLCFKNRFCSVEVLCEGFSGAWILSACLPWEDCYSWWTKVSPLLSKALLYAARLDTMQGPAAAQDFVWSTMLQWQRATPYESIQTAENRISRIPFYFSISDFCRTCDQLFFLSHDQFLDPQLTGIPWSSNASWFLIGTCITGKVPRRFFGKIRRCSLLACVLAQHWHFLSMLFFHHLGALNTRCLDR